MAEKVFYVLFVLFSQTAHTHGIHDEKLQNYTMINYTVGILQERGVGYTFDAPKVAPAIGMGMDIFEHILDGDLHVKFVRAYLESEGSCRRTAVGVKLAEMYYLHGINAVIGPGKYPTFRENLNHACLKIIACIWDRRFPLFHSRLYHPLLCVLFY